MMPTKNQMESDSPRPVPSAIKIRPFGNSMLLFRARLPHSNFLTGLRSCSLPEDDLQDDKNYRDYARPEKRLLEECGRSIVRDDGRAINQPVQLRLWPRFGHQTHNHCDNHADQPAP